MISAWKLKRETKRVAAQLSAIPLLIYEPFAQKLYDRNFEKNIKLYQGIRNLGKQVAVFLIYQPRGLADSIYLTVDHLVASGFEVVIVSNCPLASADLEKLYLRTALVVERPNFGYDFGGYRDAVWLLRRQGVSVSQMLFLNDSVWFPVFEKSSMLTEMANSRADYVGTQAFGRVSSDGRFDGFFGSYCFLIKQPLLQRSSFVEYWEKYRMSSSKEIVLRRGERSFSKKMLGDSAHSNAWYSHERFANVIEGLDPRETAEAVADLIVWDKELNAKKSQLLSAAKQDGEWLNEGKRLIINLAQTKNFIGSSPLVSINKLRFPMIKKNNEMLYRLARKKIVEAIDLGRVVGLHPVVERELRQSVVA